MYSYRAKPSRRDDDSCQYEIEDNLHLCLHQIFKVKDVPFHLEYSRSDSGDSNSKSKDTYEWYAERIDSLYNDLASTEDKQRKLLQRLNEPCISADSRCSDILKKARETLVLQDSRSERQPSS